MEIPYRQVHAEPIFGVQNQKKTNILSATINMNPETNYIESKNGSQDKKEHKNEGQTLTAQVKEQKKEIEWLQEKKIYDSQALTEVIYKAASSVQLGISKGNTPQASLPYKYSSSKPSVGKPRPFQFLAGQDGSIDPNLECQYCKDTGHENENCAWLAKKLTWGRQQTK